MDIAEQNEKGIVTHRCGCGTCVTKHGKPVWWIKGKAVGISEYSERVAHNG